MEINKERILDIQLEAINRYINNLEFCEAQEYNRRYAYIWVVNHYREKAGKSFIEEKEKLKIYQKWIKKQRECE